MRQIGIATDLFREHLILPFTFELSLDEMNGKEGQIKINNVNKYQSSSSHFSEMHNKIKKYPLVKPPTEGSMMNSHLQHARQGFVIRHLMG